MPNPEFASTPLEPPEELSGPFEPLPEGPQQVDESPTTPAATPANLARRIIAEKIEAARRAAEAARRPGPRRFLTIKAQQALLAALALFTSVATSAGIAHATSKAQQPVPDPLPIPPEASDLPSPDSSPKQQPNQAPETPEQEKEAIVLTGNEILDATIDRSFEQYDAPGCFNGEKDDPINIGNPGKVLEQIGNKDPNEATAKDWGLAIQAMTFKQNISAAPVAYVLGFSIADGRTVQETEAAIKELPPEQKEALALELRDAYKHTTYRIEKGDGESINQYAEKDTDGGIHSTFNRKDLTGKLVLAVETTLLEDKKITRPDGHQETLPAGTIVRYRYIPECGNFETLVEYQAPTSSEPKKENIVPAPTPENPNPDPEKPQHDSKDSAAQIAAAGPLTPMKVDPAKANSEADHEKQEAINRYEIYAQAAAMGQAAEMSQEEADRQAATEAAMVAAERNMAKANAAAAAAAAEAAAEAAAKQAAANAETARQQAAAEEAARQQAAADAAAAAQAVAAEQAPSGGVTAADFLKAAEELNKIGE